MSEVRENDEGEDIHPQIQKVDFPGTHVVDEVDEVAVAHLHRQ
jgi:hypothetical protein